LSPYPAVLGSLVRGESLAERAYRIIEEAFGEPIVVGKKADALPLPFPVVDEVARHCLQEEEPEPASVEREIGEIPLELLVLAAEVAPLVLAETGTVEAEQDVEVALERINVRSPETKVVTPFQAAPRMADVLAEARAGAGEDVLPGAAFESENRVAGGAEDATSQRGRPAAPAGRPAACASS
jgi:hypothetical protein